MSYMGMHLATSLSHHSYWREGVARGKHGLSSSNTLLAYCSREFLWYPFYFKADGVPERRGGGRRGGPRGRTHLFQCFVVDKIGSILRDFKLALLNLLAKLPA